jgi:hypothetical protein
MPQARELGKDEPRPVGLLTSFGKFLRDLVMDVRLSIHEAKKVSLSNGQPPFCRLPRDQALIMGDAGLSHESLSPPELWLRPSAESQPDPGILLRFRYPRHVQH